MMIAFGTAVLVAWKLAYMDHLVALTTLDPPTKTVLRRRLNVNRLFL